MARITLEDVARKRQELKASGTKTGTDSTRSGANSAKSGASGGISLDDVRKKQREFRLQREEQTVNSIIAELPNRINKWLDSSGQYINRYNSRFADRDTSKFISDAEQWLNDSAAQKNSLDLERDGILADIRKYGRYMNPEYVKLVTDTLGGSSKTHNDILEIAKQDRDFWEWKQSESKKDLLHPERRLQQDKAVGSMQTALPSLSAVAQHVQQWNNDVSLASDPKLAELHISASKRKWESKKAEEKAAKDAYDAFMNQAVASAQDTTGGDSEKAKQEAAALLATYQGTVGAAKRAEEDYQRAKEKYGGMVDYYNKWWYLTEEDGFQIGASKRNYNNPTKQDLYDWDTSETDASIALSAGGTIDEAGNVYDARGNLVRSAEGPAIEDRLGLFLAANEDDIKLAPNTISANGGAFTDTYANLLKEGAEGNWQELDETEVELYYKIKELQGDEAAYAYLKDTEEILNQRAGSKAAQEIAAIDNDTERFLATATLAVEAGLQQWGSGVKQIFADGEIPTSAAQYASAEVQASLNGLAKYAYMAANQVGYMLPSIFVSRFLGLAGAAPKVAEIAGAVTMSSSAGGNAYTQAMKEGYSKERAAAYGILVAASEGTLQYLIGGITDLGGIGTGKILSKLSAIDNVFLRLSAKGLIQNIDEITEEELQNYLEPVFRSVLFGEEYDLPTLEEQIETAIVTALSTSAMNARGNAMEAVADISMNHAQKLAEQNALHKLANEMHGVEEMENTAQMDGVKYSIKRTQNMSWDEQITGALSHGKSILRNDTLVLDDTPATLVNDGVESKKLAIPLSVITKAKSGKDASHSIQDANLKDLQRGVRNAPIVINNPARNALVFITDIQQDGAPILVAFQKNAQFDGDDVHKATSIHLQMNVASMLKALPSDATVYAKNESELDAAVGVADSLRSLAASVKFTGDTVTENAAGVNGENSSSEGQVLRGSNPVQIADVESADGGKLTVRLTDGSTADISELSFPNVGEQELWRVLAEYSDHAEAARQLLKEYRAGDLQALEYAKGVEEGFLYGKLNISDAEMSRRGSYVNLLNPMQKNMAYKYGQYAGEKQAKRQQEKINGSKTRKKNKSGQLHYEGDRNKLTERQKVSLQTCEIIAKALGIQVYVFESKKNNQGKRVGDNGWYDPKDSSIHIDLYAGENSEGVMAFTMAHELGHFIKDWSPTKFRTLAKFLAEQYGQKGLSVRDMVLLQQEKAEANGRKLTFEQAHEEWVCDSLETMLTDGAVLEKMAMLQAKDKGLVQKIKRFLTEFLERLKAAYTGVSPQTKEGRIISEMVDTAQQLRDLFTDALVDAGETYKSADKNTTGEGGVRFCSRGSVPTEFNPKGLSLEEQLKEILDTAQSFDGRYLYIGKFTDGFIKKMSKYVEIKDYPIVMNYRDAYLSMESKEKGRYQGDNINYHNIGSEGMMDAINSFDDPEAVMLSKKNGKIELAIRGVDRKGQPLLAIVEINTSAQNAKKFVRAHVTASIYGKRNMENYIKKAETADRLIYKKQEEPAQGIPQVQYKGDINANSSKTSIRKSIEIVKENDSIGRRSSARSGEAVSDRAILVDMFAQTVTSSSEYKALENYRKHIQEMQEIEEKLERISAEIRRLSFAEGPRDTETLNRLKLQQKQAVNRLNNYDNILLRLEKSGVLRAMIERSRKQITQESFDRAKEYYQERNERREADLRQHYQESRRKAVERHDLAQVRQQIRKDVAHLDSLLNKGTKNKNVKLGLQDFVGAVLRTAKGVFLNDYNEYDMIRNGMQNKLLPEEQAAFDRCRELLKELDKLRDEQSAQPGADNLHDKWDPEAALRREDREEALKRELYQNMRILRDGNVFQRERAGTEQATAEELLNELLSAYKALENSELEHIRGVYNEALYKQIEKVKSFLAGKAIKDMTSVELKELQKMYRMVSHTVSHANELFGKRWTENVRERGEKAIRQLRTAVSKDLPEFLEKVASFGWSILSLDTAMEIIGSEVLLEHVQELYDAEDTYQRDLEHAREFAEDQAKKYRRKEWKLDKQVSFAGTTITIGQAMSLYAYSRRKQGQGHLEGDGFTHSKNVRIKKSLSGKLPVQLGYIKNATQNYKVTREMYEELEKLLTPEQREYVKAMQEYLSKVMGAKGNEVSEQLHGIPLFEETIYFPLKTAKEFSDTALGATTGERKMKNTGFTEAVKKGADNAIVLDDFERVWSEHVNQMSNYHAYVLAMENFNRVYNYRHAVEREVRDAAGEVYKTELVDTNESVKLDIENRVGSAANAYIVKYMQNLNGGTRSDATEALANGLLGNFRKTRVLGSGSVIVQQPSAFLRAMAKLDIRDLTDWKQWRKKYSKPPEGLRKEMYRYCPVAGIKKMGGFDPSVGRTARQYLFGEYHDGENPAQRVTGWVNEKLGMLPEAMDEVTWTYIWYCSKQQIRRTSPGLRVGSQEFCQEAAKLFSQIVRETQVYDSITVKPLMMQSKNTYLKTLTSFMNEPLKGLNQMIRAWARVKHGKTKARQAVRETAAVFAADLAAGALSAFFYALRDDDDDETYWEKYLSALTGKVWESLIPLYKLPYIKDILSLLDGYSASRSDTALVNELLTGLETIFKESKATTPEEAEREVWTKLEKGYGYLLNFAGIPGSNLIREIRGIYNTAKKTWEKSWVDATAAGTKYALLEGLPFGEETSKQKQLENAVAEDDMEHLQRVLGTWDNQDTALSNLRTAIKEVWLAGKITDDRAMEYLQELAGHDAEEAQDYITKWEFKKAHPGTELTDAKIIQYADVAEPAGISLDIYTQYVEWTKDLSSDEDGQSKQEKVWAVIHSLPISRKQKDALHYASGYRESSLDEAPWN